MKKKILPRIFIFLLAVTIISTIAVSSVFAKYVSSGEGEGIDVRPAAFDIEFSGFDVDKISVNFAKDGVPAPALGYSKDTYVIPFGIKNIEESEIAANVIIKLEFDPDFAALINRDNSGDNNGFSCGLRIYQKVNSAYTEIAYQILSSTQWATDALLLPVGQTLDCKLEVDVSYFSAESVPSDEAGTINKIRYITDAITIKVDATSVNP